MHSPRMRIMPTTSAATHSLLFRHAKLETDLLAILDVHKRQWGGGDEQIFAEYKVA
jgi:hypothetical protein